MRAFPFDKCRGDVAETASVGGPHYVDFGRIELTGVANAGSEPP
jgi:hypothetical protein